MKQILLTVEHELPTDLLLDAIANQWEEDEIEDFVKRIDGKLQSDQFLANMYNYFKGEVIKYNGEQIPGIPL